MRLAPILALLLTLACSGTSTPPGDDGGGSDPVVPLPVALQHYGKGYQAWVAGWVQWLYAIPAAASPERDETGARCGAAQSGPVFFLADADHSVSRTCTISSALALLVPVAPALAHQLGIPQDQQVSADELQGKLTILETTQSDFYASLDRTVYGNLESYDIPSVQMSFTENTEDPLVPLAADQQDGVASPAFAGGVFVLFPPLSKGSHRLVFGYTPDGAAPIRITYDLQIM